MHRAGSGTQRTSALFALACIVWGSGCGGDGGTEPTPPPRETPRPASVTVGPAAIELTALGATVQLAAEVRDQNGNVMAGTATTWASVDASVATVDRSGLVTAVANGTTTITATAGSVSGSATATVAQQVSYVEVTPATGVVMPGTTLRLMAEAKDANTHVVDGAEFAWASSDTTVAVVDSTGLVTGTGEGETEVSATSSGVTGRAQLEVVKPPPPPPPPPTAWGPANTYAVYTFPDSSYRRLEWTMLPVQAPPESLKEKGLLHYYAMTFYLTPDGRGGSAGFQTDGHFKGESVNGRVINFNVHEAREARSSTALVDSDNEECHCSQMMLPYEWEAGREYRFVLDTGPSGESDTGRWLALWVTDVAADSTVFVGEALTPNRHIDMTHAPISWGEDLHFWHTLEGRVMYQCEDFEPSSLAVLDVLADGVSPASVNAYTNGGTKATGSNGHETTLCDTAIIYSNGTDTQHNLGYWSVPPKNVLEGR